MAVPTTNAAMNFLRALLPTLNGLTLRLAKADWSPSIATVEGDIDECTFPGYAPVNLSAWGLVFADALGNAESDYAIIRFRQTALAAPVESVWGWYLTAFPMRVVASQKRSAGPLLLGQPIQEYAVAPFVSLRPVPSP